MNITVAGTTRWDPQLGTCTVGPGWSISHSVTLGCPGTIPCTVVCVQQGYNLEDLLSGAEDTKIPSLPIT